MVSRHRRPRVQLLHENYEKDRLGSNERDNAR